jgi:large subunit ribosomal protein L9
LQKAARARLTEADERAEALAEITINLTANASEEGKLYGSIGPREISDALGEEGFKVEKSEVIMGEGPIRMTGEYDVHLQLHADVEQIIKLVIEAE